MVLEICVDSLVSARAAIAGGADRLELCSALLAGGLTPYEALLRQIRAESDIPIRCLMRPRPGDFLYTPEERELMRRQILQLKNAGANGFVIGCLTPQGDLDVDAMNELYLAMDLDHVQNAGYQDMLNEMVPLCGQAIDWKKSSILADHGTDTALRDLLEGLADKVKDIDTESLMQYAGILSEGTKGLGEGGILQGLLNSRKA